jgi:hypothetical protein
MSRRTCVTRWFNISIFAGAKSWVAGVELATASEPPALKPRIWGRRPSGVDPSHPLSCNVLLNFALFTAHRLFLTAYCVLPTAYSSRTWLRFVKFVLDREEWFIHPVSREAARGDWLRLALSCTHTLSFIVASSIWLHSADFRVVGGRTSSSRPAQMVPHRLYRRDGKQDLNPRSIFHYERATTIDTSDPESNIASERNCTLINNCPR